MTWQKARSLAFKMSQRHPGTWDYVKSDDGLWIVRAQLGAEVKFYNELDCIINL